jgi:hypothetical protein
MKRVYTSTAHFRAPFDTPNISFAGLGQTRSWPMGRTYYNVSDFRAPYDNGYYQSGGLRGLETIVFEHRAWAAAAATAALAGLIFADKGKRFEGAKIGLALGGLAAGVALWNVNTRL